MYRRNHSWRATVASWISSSCGPKQARHSFDRVTGFSIVQFITELVIGRSWQELYSRCAWPVCPIACGILINRLTSPVPAVVCIEKERLLKAFALAVSEH